jgi:hypothetical protein
MPDFTDAELERFEALLAATLQRRQTKAQERSDEVQRRGEAQRLAARKSAERRRKNHAALCELSSCDTVTVRLGGLARAGLELLAPSDVPDVTIVSDGRITEITGSREDLCSLCIALGAIKQEPARRAAVRIAHRLGLLSVEGDADARKSARTRRIESAHSVAVQVPKPSEPATPAG